MVDPMLAHDNAKPGQTWNIRGIGRRTLVAAVESGWLTDVGEVIGNVSEEDRSGRLMVPAPADVAAGQVYVSDNYDIRVLSSSDVHDQGVMHELRRVWHITGASG